MGAGVRGSPGRLSLPAGGTDPGRRRHRPQRHPLQLLRHGHHPRRHGRHLCPSARGCTHAPAGRRHRLRLLDASPKRCAGERRGRGCVRSCLLHGSVGRDVPHHHVGRFTARRDDGDTRLRSSRHRRFRRRQAHAGTSGDVQSLRARDGRVHGRREERRAVGPEIRRPHLQDAAGARIVGSHHACDLRLRRTRHHLHRPHQRREQPRLRGNHPRDQSVR